MIHTANLLSSVFFLGILYRVNSLTADDLPLFFNATFLRKATGIFSGISKNYQEGYDPGWEFYHFHHVCVPKGSEGIYVGLQGVKNEWKSPDGRMSNQYMSEEDFNNLRSSDFSKRNLMIPYRALRFEKDKPPKDITFIKGGSYFLNCEFPSPVEYYKDADLLVKTGILYELGEFQMKNAGEEIWKFPWPVPFQSIFMNRCHDPSFSTLSVASKFLDVVKSKLKSANLTTSETKYTQESPVDKSEKYVCFEDMIFSSRMDTIIEGQQNQISFRHDAALITGEPSAVLTTPEVDVDVPESGIIQPHCKRNNPAITVIGPEGFDDSIKMTNMQQVSIDVQEFTMLPVKVMTIKKDTSFADIIKMFSSSDIIVTTTGPHLLAGLFMPQPYTKAIIELSPFLINPIYYSTFRRYFNFAEYVLSTGHPFSGSDPICVVKKEDEYLTKGCNKTHHSWKRLHTDRFTCPAELLPAAAKCPIEVNEHIKFLTGNMISTTLCKDPLLPMSTSLKPAVHEVKPFVYSPDAVNANEPTDTGRRSGGGGGGGPDKGPEYGVWKNLKKNRFHPSPSATILCMINRSTNEFKLLK